MERERVVLRSILSQSIRNSPTSSGEPLRNKAVASHRTPKGAVRMQNAFEVRELARAFPQGIEIANATPALTLRD